MFGGESFMVNDKMVTHAMKDGDLLVRVDPQRDRELTELPGASRAEMGPGRTMGPGWISVSAEAIAGEELSSGSVPRWNTTNPRRETRSDGLMHDFPPPGMGIPRRPAELHGA